VAVVTVSRTCGSGGLAVARCAAEFLGYALLDKGLIAEVARMSEVPEREVASVDEVGSGFLAGLVSRLLLNPVGPVACGVDPWGGGFGGMVLATEPSGGGSGGSYPFDRDHLVFLTEQVIRAAADRGDAVIVGRGAQAILADREEALHVRIDAPFPDRVCRVAEREGLNLRDAASLVRRTDLARDRYLRRYHRADAHDSRNYHIVLNTGRTGIEPAADLLSRTVRRGLYRIRKAASGHSGVPARNEELLAMEEG
jgi:cytidylate kinase